MKNSDRFKILIFQTVFGLALFFIWLRFIDLEAFASYFGKINVLLIVFALSFAVLANIIRFVRWKLILNPLVDISYRRIFVYGYLQSLFNYFFPIRAGELGVSFLIKKMYALSYTKVLATTFLNRSFDFLGILALALISSLILILFDNRYIPIFSLLLASVIVILPFVYLVYFRELYSSKTLVNLVRLLSKLALVRKIIPYLKDFYAGLLLMKKERGLITPLSFLTLISFIFDGAFLFLVFKAFGISVFYPLVLFGTVLFTLSFLIPAAPLYIGSVEIAGSLIFTFVLGLDKNAVASVIVFWHFLNSFLIISLGLISLWVLNTKDFKRFRLNQPVD